ncbi:unnamed protein product [Ranitomeya imitator]|uniref:Uncharacterized protein n=1 Tax=Ranitomeya imitator TaxID=111125 RepID=A0ABN9M3F5_9NEOB|nr:unnamed protein product [Ranitomeya imitator]
MFDEVLNFCSASASKNQSLQQVTFMLHPNDQETIKEFNKELSARKIRSPTQSGPGAQARHRSQAEAPSDLRPGFLWSSEDTDSGSS